MWLPVCGDRAEELPGPAYLTYSVEPQLHPPRAKPFFKTMLLRTGGPHAVRALEIPSVQDANTPAAAPHVRDIAFEIDVCGNAHIAYP